MLRQEDFAEAERLLKAMDAAYEVLMSIGYPDAITRRAADGWISYEASLERGAAI